MAVTLSRDGWRRRMPRMVSALLAAALLTGALSGCGCRPGFVGPYGGLHPPRCWVG